MRKKGEQWAQKKKKKSANEGPARGKGPPQSPARFPLFSSFSPTEEPGPVSRMSRKVYGPEIKYSDQNLKKSIVPSNETSTVYFYS